MATLPKWTDERTDQLTNFVGDESPVSQATVAEAAETLETTTRSISSKLRKMGYDVELASSSARALSVKSKKLLLKLLLLKTQVLIPMPRLPSIIRDGAFSAKSIQGKILSMELTGHVKPAPVKEAVRTYTPAEEATFVTMVNDGAFVEAIADVMGRSVNSVRGKALSLLRSGEIDAIPRQEVTKSTSAADPFAALSDITAMTVEAIADEIGKTLAVLKLCLLVADSQPLTMMVLLKPLKQANFN